MHFHHGRKDSQFIKPRTNEWQLKKVYVIWVATRVTKGLFGNMAPRPRCALGLQLPCLVHLANLKVCSAWDIKHLGPGPRKTKEGFVSFQPGSLKPHARGGLTSRPSRLSPTAPSLTPSPTTPSRTRPPHRMVNSPTLCHPAPCRGQASEFASQGSISGAPLAVMSTGPIFQEVAGKFDLWRSRRWRSGFKSDTIRTLQPLHHSSVGYQPSTTWLTLPRRFFLQVNRRAQVRR
jgi:hypothetical protein